MRVLPPGIQNNNPVNLRPLPAGQSWAGQTGADERGLCIFDTVELGYRAGAKTLHAYGRNGWNTLAAIYAHWAPAGDGGNDPEAYAKTVAGLTGFGVDQVLAMDDPAVQLALLRASTRVENGDPALFGRAVWFPDSVIVAGIAMAAP